MKKITPLLLISTCIWANELPGIDQQAKNLTAIQKSYPSISPDGNQVVYQTNQFGHWQLMTMNIDGTDIKRLTYNENDDIQPVWSPDGRHILFVSNRSGNEDIFMLNTESNTTTQLTNDPGRDIHPVWHPSLDQVIFNTNRDDGETFELYTMDLKDQSLNRLTDNNQSDTYASWSPDGKRIAFVRWTESPDDSGNIYVLTADLKKLTQVTKHSAFDGWPVWLDNETLVFSSYRTTPNQLFKTKVDGSELIQLTFNDEANARAHVRGPHMVYNGAKDGVMHIYRVDSNEINTRHKINSSGD